MGHDRADSGSSEPFVELAPTRDAVIGGHLHEVVVPPSGVATVNLDDTDGVHTTVLPSARSYRSSASAISVDSLSGPWTKTRDAMSGHRWPLPVRRRGRWHLTGAA